MSDGENRHTKRVGDSLLAGLAAGVVAVLGLLSWQALASAWYRRSIWSTANIMATSFYGEAALRPDFTFRTLAGLAVYVVVYGTLGALFGFSVQTRAAGLRLVLIGVLVGLGWYYLSFLVIWRRLNPLISLYTHAAPMMAGHMLFGGLLARFPRYLSAPRQAAPHAG